MIRRPVHASAEPHRVPVSAGEKSAVGPAPEPAAEPVVVLEDLLVEDVSIDGMCGVY